MQNHIFISVIVPFFNEEKHIEKCVKGLLHQNYPKSSYEIILIDNNSTDNSLNIAKKYPSIKVIQEKRKGSYSARNSGMRIANGDIIAFTDSDCIPDPGWLQTIQSEMALNDIGILLGAHSINSKSKILSLLIDYGNERSKYVFNSNNKKIYYGQTNNMAVLKNIFDIYGLFIERERGSDTIFVQRCLKDNPSSFVKYSEKMIVQHLEINNILKLYKKFYIYAKSRKMYKHIASVQRLGYFERLSIFLKAIKNGRYNAFHIISSFFILGFGLFFWFSGGIAGKYFK